MRSFTRRHALAGSALALSLLAAWPLQAAESVVVGDVPFEPTAQVQGRTLVLNGAGVRYKAVFKVYAAGLYLEKKAATPAEVHAQKGPKRLTVTMLRDIDSTELGRLFSRGVEDNMDKAAFSKLVPGVLRMSQIFSEHKMLKAGDVFTIDWLPGTGTLVSVKGQPQGEPFKEPAFFDALLGIWLGHQPADWKLKDALLGKS
ncbi:chalcone isomerase family protein [Pulveribacter suum]|uniref:Chalcone isomerase domain-containing protein n=1 Tax=Pulveribacter suum TaxID=2116657 RepID=A0A2P1NHF5_9BURK|nr:chalcone isomerase family protein [Pulveribacter suum]AVP56487.1 hypothetical protein C7H73_01555 [Pulveribacter suum]